MSVLFSITRREFLRATLTSSLAFATGDFFFALPAQGSELKKPDLAVARGSSPSRITRSAIEALGGMKRFVSPGEVVVVKPNIGWDRTPEYAANTNPQVAATVIQMCYEAGAKKVKVFDHTVANPQRCYMQSGIAEAARATGGEVIYVNERKFREVKLPGYALKSWPLYAEVFEADKVINVPIAKTHGLTKLTLGMKNWMGIMGGWRGRLHQRINESLVDVSLTIKPALIVLDAIRILTANGPQGGDLADVKVLNTVVAGVDQVAVDAYGATLFGLTGNDIGYIRLGQEAGLGTMDLKKLNIRHLHV
ncbi:MAG TPA: DUF362 domain-containing protein [Syntrophales bacterium]|nr:DUF362 domain-containing protein [Syntrophales bacterium]HOL59491.1 DUF362 domain-containing protein [Syntrophales bacterium]HPO34673.1 DUF362 domain-containing protein [Syntrophales bacterium]